MKLFLGVDGGQSGTTVAIGDETGLVCGVGEAGPSNHVGGAEGRDKLQRAVRAGLRRAAERARLDTANLTFESACFGMSGGPDDKEAILAAAVRTAHLLVTTDAAVALAGATRNGQGIVVIAGTGSMALGRNGVAVARSGGWGYVYGDEGGAFDIVRQAVRAALRMEEHWGPDTALRAVLLEATQAASVNQMLHWFYNPAWERARVAALAPLVDRAANEGDAVASRVMNQAAQQLAELAAAVRARLWLPNDAVEVAYAGGVFGSRMLLERFRVLVELEAGNRAMAPRQPAYLGALLEAYRVAGVSVELRGP